LKAEGARELVHVCLLESFLKSRPLEGYRAFPFIAQGKGLEYMRKDREKRKRRKRKNRREGKES
jgi:hypothetical protein